MLLQLPLVPAALCDTSTSLNGSRYYTLRVHHLLSPVLKLMACPSQLLSRCIRNAAKSRTDVLIESKRQTPPWSQWLPKLRTSSCWSLPPLCFGPEQEISAFQARAQRKSREEVSEPSLQALLNKDATPCSSGSTELQEYAFPSLKGRKYTASF